ncbi:hypothetical protein K7X08_002108 [Anisodus acutangulus]|uniref:Uncharacterized protein n=1 Tax=Anisodus acutangulus TaxID=402998 RepID=A0A9Q1LNW0_9SOLA|nr:hypothetical protein K7X08_002108 [Anisodus acutangulus]
MEESEKRKERLKAIGEEAAEAGDNTEEQNSIGAPLDHGLTNPFIETPSGSSGQDEPRPRFDYYTDPMLFLPTTSALRFNNHVTRHQLIMLKANITRLKERTSHEESMPFLLESVGTPLTLWVALSAHLTTTLHLIHRKLVIFPVMASLKEVELVANMDKAAPTKVLDPEPGLTEVQEEAGVDSNFTITSQWWKTHGKP